MNIIALNFSGATVSGMAFNESNTVTDDTGDMVMKCLSGLYQYRNRIDSIEAETYMYGVTDIVKKNILISPLRRFIFVGNKPKDGFFETFGKIQYFFLAIILSNLKHLTEMSTCIQQECPSVSITIYFLQIHQMGGTFHQFLRGQKILYIYTRKT